MDDQPQVSVIIPCLNGADTLERTLLSVEQQEVVRFEAVLVDDGSTDGTAEIMRGWAERDRRFRAIQAEHGGVSAARNVGLSIARADWCLFLDADDVLEPAHLISLVSRVKLDPDACVVFGGWQNCFDTGARGPRQHRDLTEPFATTARMCPFAIHSAIVRRSILNELGGFELGRAIAEDWDLWQRIARTGGKFVPAPQVTALISVRQGSASSNPQKLFEAGREIIRRGHQADGRVPNPLPIYAHGQPPADGLAAELFHYAYCAANALGRGRGFPAWAAHSEAAQVALIDAGSLADTLVAGLNDGAAEPFAWISRWEELRLKLEVLISSFERSTAPPLLCKRALRKMDWSIACRREPDEPAQVGRLMVAPVDLHRPLKQIRVPQNVELLDLRVRRGTDSAARIRSLVTGSTITKGQIEEQLRLEGIDPPLKASAAFKRALSWLRTHQWRTFSRQAQAAVQNTAEHGSGEEPQRAEFDERYWQQVFSTEDPWSYENAYERLKYEQTLAALPAERSDRVLELACAEGHFTVHLAQRARDLVATDISSRALERAAARCAGLNNVRFEQLNLLESELPTGLDLIVCSEVLYYLENREALAKLSAKIASALKPGGALVMAHADLLVDGGRSGFTWPHAFGAAGIGVVFASHPDLHLDVEWRSGVYRIQRFIRKSADAAEPPAEIIQVPFVYPPANVAANLWVDGVLAALPEPGSVPVLAYHQICGPDSTGLSRYAVTPAKFEAQLSWLRDNGYRGLTLAEFQACVWDGTPCSDRSVLLTFDDGYQDTFEVALPLLERYGFAATIFLPTGFIGGRAEWDAAFGPPAPLMDWDAVRAARKRGFDFALHGAAHLPLTGLNAEALRQDIAHAQQVFTAELGEASSAIAYPYGDHDEPSARELLRLGLKLGFAMDRRWWRRGGNAMTVPRIEVFPDTDEIAFARIFEGRGL